MKNKAFLFIAIFSTTLFACSKSKTEPVPPPITAVSQGLPVKRISHTFSATENHEHTNWIFNYSNNMLVGGSSQIRFTSAGQIYTEPSLNFGFIRSATTISGTLSQGTFNIPFTGTLNSQGYLASLSLEDDYTFSYTSDGYLKKMILTGPDEITTVDFTYSSGNLTAFHEQIQYQNVTTSYTGTFQYGSIVNKSGVWPPQLDDTDDLPIFYYAALLGKPTKNLAISCNLQGYENINETYTYTYTDGYIATCLRNASSTVNGSTRTSSDLVTYAYN